MFVARKIDELNAAGKLDTYPLDQRIKDLNEPPRCSVCGAVVDGDICDKCEGEAFLLAHRQRPAAMPGEATLRQQGGREETQRYLDAQRQNSEKRGKKPNTLHEMMEVLQKSIQQMTEEEKASLRESLYKTLPSKVSQKPAIERTAGTQDAAMKANGVPVQITGDVGPQVLDFIFKEMQIDSQWSIRNDRALTWWGYRLAQRIWAEPVFVEDGDEIIRVHAETDLLRNVPEVPKTAEILSQLNHNVNLSGFVWDTQAKKIRLRCSAYFHAENLVWLRKVFLCAISIQAAEAHVQPEILANQFNAEADQSGHPTNGFRPTKDEMLGIIEGLFAPQGAEPSAFTSNVFQSAMKMNPAPWVMANAGDDGLTAEFPFPGCMPPTALLTVDNKAKHPRLGSGVFLSLRLPLNLGEVEAARLASGLNSAELTMPTRSHFMGAWCVDGGRKELWQKGIMLAGAAVPADFIEQKAKGTLTYRSFLPTATYRQGLLETFLYNMANRARWANEYLASLEGMSDLFGPRDARAFQRQSEEHASLLSRLLTRIRRSVKQKPN